MHMFILKKVSVVLSVGQIIVKRKNNKHVVWSETAVLLPQRVMTCRNLNFSQEVTELSDTYRSSSFLIVDLKVSHGFDDGHNGLDCVAVDNCSVLLTLVF